MNRASGILVDLGHRGRARIDLVMEGHPIGGTIRCCYGILELGLLKVSLCENLERRLRYIDNI